MSRFGKKEVTPIELEPIPIPEYDEYELGEILYPVDENGNRIYSPHASVHDDYDKTIRSHGSYQRIHLLDYDKL